VGGWGGGGVPRGERGTMALSTVCVAARGMVCPRERLILPAAGPAGVHRVASGRPYRWHPSRRAVNFKSALAVHNRRDCARRRISGASLLAAALGQGGGRTARSLWLGRIRGGHGQRR